MQENKILLRWRKDVYSGAVRVANTSEFTKWSKKRNIKKSKPIHWAGRMYSQWEFADSSDMVLFMFNDTLRSAVVEDSYGEKWERASGAMSVLNRAILKYLGSKAVTLDQYRFQVPARQAILSLRNKSWPSVGIEDIWDVTEENVEKAIKSSIPRDVAHKLATFG